MGLRAPHTCVPKGKRVRVVLRSGESFIDKFVEHKSGRVVLATRSVLTRELKSMTIVR